MIILMFHEEFCWDMVSVKAFIGQNLSWDQACQFSNTFMFMIIL